MPAYMVRTSWKIQTPNTVCRTDRHAEENMWVTGEVILMLRSPVGQVKRQPISNWYFDASLTCDAEQESDNARNETSDDECLPVPCSRDISGTEDTRVTENLREPQALPDT